MASGVHTTVLYHGLSGAANLHNVYACPEGKTAIIKDVRAAANGSGAGALTLGVRSGPVTVWLHPTLTASSNAFLQLEFWVVLRPGGSLQTLTDQVDSWALHVSGTELDGVATGGAVALPF